VGGAYVQGPRKRAKGWKDRSRNYKRGWQATVGKEEWEESLRRNRGKKREADERCQARIGERGRPAPMIH